MSNAPTWESACPPQVHARRHGASALLSAAAVLGPGPTARREG